jgi:pyruvate dehydrogenase phosphatase
LQEILTPHLKRRIPPNYISPPYVTALPEVVHYKRDRNDKFLVLACDGLWDDLESETAVKIVKNLVEEKYQGNYATVLMKAAMSGCEDGGKLEDLERIRHLLSIPAPKSRRYRDDMTVNVVIFENAVPGLNVAPGKVDSLNAKPTINPPQIYNYCGILKNRPPPSKL